MAYGDKRDYKKIDLYVDGEYKATTTWSRTCREAVAAFKDAHPNMSGVVKARFKR